jgi:cytochrome oxidase Cu insertion factor (SCO1/SenC/PrrC family)
MEFNMRSLCRTLLIILMMIVSLGSLPSALAQQAKTPKDVPPAPRFKVGDTAPDFTLKDQNGKDVSLHDFRGKKSVALAFFVFAFTGG